MNSNNIPSAIIFFGPDGSGKTTQANLLVDELNKRGLRNKKIWIRSLHTLAYILSIIAMHLLNLDSVYEFRSKFGRNRTFRNIWFVIEFISILGLIITRFNLPMRNGYVIVAERFVVDWIVSLAYVVHEQSFINSHLSNLALRLIPCRSSLFYIDADLDVIASRRTKEDSDEFIQFQRSCYNIFATRLNALRIDTSNKNKDEVFSIIKEHLLQEDLKH